MAEGKTNLFGKTYNTIGSTDSNFLIKTKGDLKVQWGGKYIDVIKNGKIAHSLEKFILLVESEEDIKGTGIYVTPENKIFISVDDTTIDISGVSENTYVSFLEEQLVDDKTIALRNIGFYYESLERALSQKITSGIVFIENENCLYLIKDGTYTKYSGSSNISTTSDIKETLLYIEGNSLLVDGVQYIECANNQVTIYKNVVLKDGILSEYANQDRGFRLYMFEGKSYLEIDYIKLRAKEIVEKDQHFPLYSLKDNIAQKLTIADDRSQVDITLWRTNEYLVGEYIYVIIKRELYEYEIIKVEDLTISVKIDPEISQDFLDYCYNIYLSRSPYIHIEKGDLKVLDRSKELENNGVIILDEYPHTLIGLVIEEELEIPEKYSEEDSERPKVGIYSDNIIAANPIFYNATFKKYPEYHKDTKSPEELLTDIKYDQVVPNIKWIKLLLDLYIPVGSIIMYNGLAEIPEGWAICDGNNGTPNLINKFIKSSDGFIMGGSSIGDNSDSVDPNLSEDNKITLTEEHLPKHSHPHKSHTHSMGNASSTYIESDTYSYEDTTGEETLEEYATDYYTESVSHTHTIQSATSEELDKSWTNKSFSIEPHAYKLIFIMKVHNFAKDVNES